MAARPEIFDRREDTFYVPNLMDIADRFHKYPVDDFRNTVADGVFLLFLGYVV